MREASAETSDSASDISERTVVTTSSAASDAADEVPKRAQQSHHLDRAIELVDVWHFLLSPCASDLRRFKASDFAPGETAVNDSEGTSYRVVRSMLSDVSRQAVAIKHLIHRESSSSHSKYEGDLKKDDRAVHDDTIGTALRELRILTHKPVQQNSHIARILGYGAEQIGHRSSLYIVADFAPFGTLQDYLRTKVEGSISYHERAEFCYDIVSGLSGIHACGIAHGDVKLNNMLVFADGDGAVAKLSDFGNSIFDGTSRYVGTALYNAPEIRRESFPCLRSRNDCYRCDIFSYGLSVWEVLQSGKSFIDATLLEDPVSWLNDLPKDDLLLMALQAFEATIGGSIGPRRIIRLVLEGALRETPEERIDSAAIVDIFNSDKMFSESKRITSSSYVKASELPPLETWSLSRTDNLAKNVPSSIQNDFVARLEQRKSNHTSTKITETASFDLAMCYLTGFGVNVDPQRSCELLLDASLHNDPRAFAICRRLHESFGIPMTWSAPRDQPILEVEEDLRLTLPASYYSQRIRRHERVAQRTLIDSVVNIFSGENLIVENIAMTDFDALERVLSRNISDISLLRAVFPLLANKVPTSFIHLAARLGHLRLIQFLIQVGVSVNAIDEIEGSLLIAACRGGHTPVVECLMANGACSRQRQDNGISPFHWMMMFEDSDLVPIIDLMKSNTPSAMNSIVVKAIEFPDHALSLEGSPVHFAVSVRNLALTKALLDAGAQFGGRFGKGGLSPLDIAVANHCPEMTDLLLSHNLPSLQETPLLHLGETKTLKLLLMHSSHRHDMLEKTVDRVLESEFSDINAKNFNGYTPLAEAIQQTQCEFDMHILETLIDRRAQVNVEVWRLMHCLLSRNDASPAPILALLLNMGALKVDIELLCRAASLGCGAIIDVVLKAGVDANGLNSEGLSALQCAVQFPGNAHAISSLLDYGADIDFISQHSDLQKTSVLEFCVMLPVGDGDMLDVIIARGASLVFNNGFTIVHQASRLFSKVNGIHILKHLLKHSRVRAFIDSSCDGDPIRPLHLACFQGNLDAINVLLDAGAEVNLQDTFNPISIIESVAKDPHILSVAWTRSPVDLSHWKRVAEIVLLRLLDKTNPGHGRTQLHVAASLGNFERVVQLVNRGAEPWRGDREKATPLALLPPEAPDPDAEISDPRTEGYIAECRKIWKFLRSKMFERVAQVSSFEVLFDHLPEVSLEDSSPPQLESRYRDQMEARSKELGENHLETLLVTAKLAETFGFQQRWSEAETSQLRVLQAMERSLNEDDANLLKARSDRIRILLELKRLDEAEDLAKMAFWATREMFDGTQTSSPSENSDQKAVFSQYVNLGKYATAVAGYDMCRVHAAQGKHEKSIEVLELIAKEIGSAGGFLLPVSLQISCDLMSSYCAMSRWEDARRRVDWLLGSLEFVKEEDFPIAYFDIIKAAKVYTKVEKYEEARALYQKLYENIVKLRARNSYYSTLALTELLRLYKFQSKHKDASKIQQDLVGISKGTVGSRSVSTQHLILELAELYGEQGRWLEAGILQEQAVDVLQATMGSNDEHTLLAKKNLCKTRQTQSCLDQAEILAREVMVGYETTRGTDDQTTIKATGELASILTYQDRCEEAIQLCREILQKQESKFGELHEFTRRAISDLGATCVRANIFDEAEALSKRAIRIYQSMYGDENVATTTCMYYLSSVYEKAGRIQECRDCRRQVLELERKIYRTPQEPILYTMTNLAEDHFALQEYDEAILLQQEAIAGYRGLEGNYEVQISKATIALAGSCHWGNRLVEARELYEKAVEMCRALYGDSHEITINGIDYLMVLYSQLDLFEEAEPLALEVYRYMEKEHGKDDVLTQKSLKDVISVLTSLELWNSVANHSKTLVASLERTLGEDHIEVTDSKETLSDSLAEENLHWEAELSRITILEHRRRTLPKQDEGILRAMDKLIATFMARKKYDEAEALNLELWGINQHILGKTHETSLEAQAVQANIYWFQNRFPEAEALELDIICIRSDTLGEVNPRTLDAVENLSRTYLGQGRYDEAERLALDVLTKRLAQGMGNEDEEILSIRDHLKEVYMAAERWPEAEKLAVEALEVRKALRRHEGDKDVIAALKSLAKIVKGRGDLDRAKNIERETLAERIKLFG